MMRPFVSLLLPSLLACGAVAAAQPAFEETWESLSTHEVPEWFMDAKFGIYTHWGVYAVPAHGSEWYPRNMYQKNNGVHKHHVATWGPLSEFGYKDFIPMFTAPKFDAEDWAEVFERSGAKFAGPVAEHHDGFSMWASEVNRWNVGDMGPKRDITGELVAALRKRGLKIITSFHHAFNIQGYYAAEGDWDTADPEYHDLYGKFEDQEEAHDRWLAKVKEVIDKYQPDQIWYDFGLAKIPDEYKRRMAAYYYNQEAEWGKPVIITRKGDHLPEGVGVLDIERGKMEGQAPFLWQTDDSAATNSWGWVENLRLKPAEELVHEIVDIVSKNGVLLLNVAPHADGSIPEDQKALLYEVGDWLRVNGDGIYGTRPWEIQGEGPNLFDRGRGLGSHAQGQVDFTGEDLRFTRKGSDIYIICLGWPEGDLRPAFVHVADSADDARVTLLGHGGDVEHHVSADGRLTIRLPKLAEAARPCSHAYTLKLSGFEVEPSTEVAFVSPSAVTLAADKAVLDGEKLGTETRGERVNIGFWDNPAESIHWLVRIAEPGDYLIRGEFAAGAGGTTLAVEVAGKSLVAPVRKANGWDDASLTDMGTLTFEEPGVYHLVLRAADADNWRAVNVWRLQLAPG